MKTAREEIARQSNSPTRALKADAIAYRYRLRRESSEQKRRDIYKCGQHVGNENIDREKCNMPAGRFLYTCIMAKYYPGEHLSKENISMPGNLEARHPRIENANHPDIAWRRP